MISKECFCKGLRMIQEQEKINEKFSQALQTVGNGYFVFGSHNKFYEALMMVLKETVGDKYDYIDWWLYEGEPDYEIWSSDESQKWILKDPEALYDYICTECQK